MVRESEIVCKMKRVRVIFWMITFWPRACSMMRTRLSMKVLRATIRLVTIRRRLSQISAILYPRQSFKSPHRAHKPRPLFRGFSMIIVVNILRKRAKIRQIQFSRCVPTRNTIYDCTSNYCTHNRYSTMFMLILNFELKYTDNGHHTTLTRYFLAWLTLIGLQLLPPKRPRFGGGKSGEI